MKEKVKDYNNPVGFSKNFNNFYGKFFDEQTRKTKFFS
jgi:hypothetical protein